MHVNNIPNNNNEHEVSVAYIPYMYTSQSCRSACLQRLIWERCHCLDLKLKLPFPDIDGKLLCGALGEKEMDILLNLSQNLPKSDKERCLFNLSQVISDNCSHIHKIINDLYCVKAVKDDYKKREWLDESLCTCNPACHSYEYDITISDSPWPAPGPETHAAYNKMKDVNWTFSDNTNIMDYFHNASNKNEIMQNFAQVVVYNKHLSITKVKEVAAYTLDDLFADMGK